MDRFGKYQEIEFFEIETDKVVQLMDNADKIFFFEVNPENNEAQDLTNDEILK